MTSAVFVLGGRRLRTYNDARRLVRVLKGHGRSVFCTAAS